jgi:hypothetical protein
LVAPAFWSSRPVANQIHVIQPYRHASTWVFDDPGVGLHQEPFVSGIPQMIDTLVANVPNAAQGFRLLFAGEPFPGYQVELVKVREEYQGVWYRWEGRTAQGWLCPALFRYFDQAPPRLYARAEPLH